MFEGYLEMGDTEIVNSARTFGYTSTSGCNASWVQCEPCDGVRDALGADEYLYTNIADAPWYDADVEATHRFFGVHGLRFEGLSDSTRTAEVTEGLLDGGYVNPVRYGTRRVRVEAALSAQGEDALETGLSWLDAALRGSRCHETHVHTEGCAAHSDVRIFTACPPEAAKVTTPTLVWNSPVTNLFTNPRAISTGSSPWGSVTVGTASYVTSFPGTITSARRHTANATTAGARLLALQLGTTMPSTGNPVRVQFKVNASHQYTAAAITARPDVTSATNQVTLTSSLTGGIIPAGQSTIEAWGNSFGAVANAASGLVLSGTPTNAAATLDVTQIIVDTFNTQGALYYDGSMTDSLTVAPYVDYGWTGTVNASTSTKADGAIVDTPDPVAHAAAVEKLTRYMHTVTAVAGPTIIQKLHRGDTWGYLVEFVLVAAVPKLYGITQSVPSSPSVPVVIQDVPFNLVPYPSAELALGTVIAATNYSDNPSVETATMNWAKGSTSLVNAADVVGSQSDKNAGGLASVGDKSYRARLTATNVSVGAGTITVENTSATFTSSVSGQRMSVNMWASSILTSGTAAIASTQIFAVWRNGSTVLRTDTIGTVPAGGGAVQGKSIALPVGTTNVIMRAQTNLSSWSVGAVVDLYADAVAVTVP